jgi:gamma-butyrobetaine dioxygenase
VTPTPDFDIYPLEPSVTDAVNAARWVEVSWADGASARFHHVWLRDNCACEQCVHPITKEQTFELVSAPAINPARAAVATADGALEVVWASDGHRSRYHPGWLRAHCYDGVAADGDDGPVVWDGSTPGVPPTFDGPALLADDDALLEWLVALRAFGVSRLRGVPTGHDVVGDVARRVGIVRETNFGVLWDVRSEPEPITNANTPLSLPPHVDLATREYQPGLQFLHCIENSAIGGEGVYLDGFRVAQILRDEHPDDFRVLTSVPWQWANRSKITDYRWSSTPIVLDRFGTVVEVRVGNWLRAPLAAAFSEVEAAYAAYRRLFELTYRDDLAIRVSFTAGDLLAFDNRRILHGRDAYAMGDGGRWLRGCYSERDELDSRIRILERARRMSRVLAVRSAPIGADLTAETRESLKR